MSLHVLLVHIKTGIRHVFLQVSCYIHLKCESVSATMKASWLQHVGLGRWMWLASEPAPLWKTQQERPLIALVCWWSARFSLILLCSPRFLSCNCSVFLSELPVTHPYGLDTDQRLCSSSLISSSRSVFLPCPSPHTFSFCLPLWTNWFLYTFNFACFGAISSPLNFSLCCCFHSVALWCNCPQMSVVPT